MTSQVRTGQVRTGQVKTVQVRTGQVRTGKVRTGQDSQERSSWDRSKFFFDIIFMTQNFFILPFLGKKSFWIRNLLEPSFFLTQLECVPDSYLY